MNSFPILTCFALKLRKSHQSPIRIDMEYRLGQQFTCKYYSFIYYYYTHGNLLIDSFKQAFRIVWRYTVYICIMHTDQNRWLFIGPWHNTYNPLSAVVLFSKIDLNIVCAIWISIRGKFVAKVKDTQNTMVENLQTQFNWCFAVKFIGSNVRFP